MHVCNRDELKAQILVLGKDADSTVTNAQLRLELEASRVVGEEAKKLQVQQSALIEKLKAALANKTVNTDSECEVDANVTNAQLRLELEVSRAVSEEAKTLQAQQSLQIEHLKAALVNEAVHVGNEREAKLEAYKER